MACAAMFCVIAVVGTIVEGLNSLASSLPVVGTAAAALVALFNIYKMVKFNKVAASNALFVVTLAQARA